MEDADELRLSTGVHICEVSDDDDDDGLVKDASGE
jgi:hypothetical protein